MTLDKARPVRLQPCMYALGLALYTSMTAMAHAEITATQLAPAQPAAAKDNAVRPFRINPGGSHEHHGNPY